MEKDTRAFLLALTAMNMRMITEIAAQTGNADAAKKQMDAFEATILEYVGKIDMPLNPGETPADLDRLRTSAKAMVRQWMSSFRFE